MKAGADPISVQAYADAMTPRLGKAALLLLLLALALFVWHTSAALPQVVASHFASSGAADGYMPRGGYVALMLALIVGVPLLVAFLPAAVAGRDGRKLNIPQREYWLAPERRESTLGFIRLHGLWFAATLALFLSYVHSLVVEANERRPPALATSGLTAGLVAFFLILAAWLFVLFARFRKRA